MSSRSGLSLTGSQIPPSPASSARSSARTKSQKPASKSGTSARGKTNAAHGGGDTTGRSTNRDDVLSFFESSQIQPKAKKSSVHGVRGKPAWGSGSDASSRTLSARSNQPSGRNRSKASTKSQYTHSVFTPGTARSGSTDEEADEFAALMTKINQSEQEMELESLVSEMTTHRALNHNHTAQNGHLLPHATNSQPLLVTNSNTNSLFSSANNLNPLLSPVNNIHPQLSPTVTNHLLSPTTNTNPLLSSSMNTKPLLSPTSRLDNTSPLLSPTANTSRSSQVTDHYSKSSLTNHSTTNNEQPSANLDKATKLNSIANNMKVTGKGKQRRPLQNPVQNQTHKTDVNQVTESALRANQLHRSTSHDDSCKQRNMAAIRIQRWYRRHKCSTLAGTAALRRLLDSKRASVSASGDWLAGDAEREAERKRIREEKARQARQQAIQELQEKRQSRREAQKQPVKYLQASGKVSLTPNHTNKAPPHAKNLNTASRSTKSSSKGRKTDSDSDGSPKQREVSNDRGGDGAAEAEDSIVHGSNTSTVTENASILTSKTATTLDDLMATLKKLEETDSLEKNSSRGGDGNKNEKPLAWLDEVEAAAAQPSPSAPYLSSDTLERLDKDNLSKSGVMTDQKLRNIISYLDDVDTAERISVLDHELSQTNAALSRPALLLPSGEDLVQLEQASAHAAEVTNTVLTQKMELEEKKRSVSILQKALNQQRELTVRHAKETEREMSKRLDIQKSEYEETIKRHLSFIDQLIDDKKALGERCETLVRELKTVDKKYADKLKTMQDNHDVELRKLKEVQAAAEKLRREKWIDDKTKKIKEMTVKGLEPEIQRLIAKHKSEIKKLKSIHEAELLASDERAGGKYVRMTEELRDQLAQEKENACARERELARKTYEKQLEQEEASYQQQQRRLYSEVREEKERLAQAASRQRAETDRLQRQLQEQHDYSLENMRQQYETAREEQEKRHEASMRQLRDQLSADKEAWEENYKKRQDAWAVQKERELKEEVRKERDQEIELVIGRLEEDTQASRTECERVAENRVKRIRDKYEAELAELERSEKHTMERYNTTKAELAEFQGENERLKVTLRQKDKEVIELKKLLEKLNEERSHVSDVIRQEFADKMVATEEENRRTKQEMAELRARHKVELERVKVDIEVVQRAKEEEMEEVHKRVKAAIVKKEEVVEQLRVQHAAAVKRADHLEGLLEQQRKQLLGSKR